MENDNNFEYEKITILVDNMPLSTFYFQVFFIKIKISEFIIIGIQIRINGQ